MQPQHKIDLRRATIYDTYKLLLMNVLPEIFPCSVSVGRKVF